MDIDKLIEDLEDNGVSKKGISKILDIITGKDEEIINDGQSKEDTITAIELALINEVDATKRTKLAAKLISMRLEE